MKAILDAILGNKKLLVGIVVLVLAGVSALVGYSVKDEICGVNAAPAAAASPAPAAAPAPAK